MNASSAERWSRLWQTAIEAVAPTGLFDRLLAMYAEPHRYYHNRRHISDCLSEFDQVRQLAIESNAVEFAIWFHDAVYNPHAADNEERSADLASECLKAGGATPVLVNSVRQLILATKLHDGTLHPDASLLVDVDLTILGQPTERFWEYEKQIRAEYSWVETTIFAEKRAEILERFLARDRIYHTKYYFERLETQARTNLRASIQRLRQTSAF